MLFIMNEEEDSEEAEVEEGTKPEVVELDTQFHPSGNWVRLIVLGMKWLSTTWFTGVHWPSMTDFHGRKLSSHS